MAQKIQLPVGLRFKIAGTSWSGVATAEPVSWRVMFGDEPTAITFRVIHPAKYEGLTGDIPLEILPLEMQPEQQSTDWIEEIYSGYDSPVRGLKPVQVLLCAAPESFETSANGSRKIDPWRMRADFLRLRRTNAELLRFLNRYGCWSRETDPCLDPESLETILVPTSHFWQIQTDLSTALRSGPATWLKAKRASFETFYVRETFPYFVHLDSYCKDAIETTLLVDFVRGEKFRKCARHDCHSLFKLESRHKRKYCDWYCGHLESVRRNRRNREAHGQNERK